MRTIVAAVLFFVLGCYPVTAQRTVVSALVADSAGTPYINCTGSADFVGQSMQPGPYLISGSVFQTSVGLRCDASGNLSVTLTDNALITPTPSQWRFSICSASGYTAGPYCFQVLITITGAAENISANLTAVAPLLPVSPTQGGNFVAKSLNGIRFADQFPGADMGAKVNAAMAAFGSTPACGEVIIPQGSYSYGTTIDLSGREACYVHGAGANWTGSTTAGTRLVWNGSAGGNLMKLAGTSRSEIAELTLDGAGLAGVCLYIPGAATSTGHNHIHDITLWNCTGTPGYALQLGDTNNYDVSRNSFDNIEIQNSSGAMNTGIYQTGTQTVSNWYSRISMTFTGTGTAPAYWAHFLAGDSILDRWTLLGNSTIAKIQVEPAVDWVWWTNIYIGETTGTTDAGIVFPAGNRPWPTYIKGLRYQQGASNAGNKCIDWHQNSTFSIQDSVFDDASGAGKCSLNFTNGSTGVAVLQWRNTVINGTSDISVSLGSNLLVDADSTAQLCQGGGSPCPKLIYSDSSGMSKVMLQSPDPQLIWRNTGAAVDAGTWDLSASATHLYGRALNDARNSATNWLDVLRGAGTAVTSVTFSSLVNTVSGYQVNGTALAASHLSNGTSGSGAVVLAAAPTITGAAILPPTAYNHSGTQQTGAHIVQDSCTLGTDCAVTLAGAAVFTSSTSYTCVCEDETAIAACKVAQTSGSAFTITGTGTDSIRYLCGGN